MSQLLTSFNNGMRKMVPCIPRRRTRRVTISEDLNSLNDKITVLKNKLMKNEVAMKKLRAEVLKLRKQLAEKDEAYNKEKRFLEDNVQKLKTEIKYLTNYLDELKDVLEYKSGKNESRDILDKNCKKEQNKPDNENEILKKKNGSEQMCKLMKQSPDETAKDLASLKSVLEMKQDEIRRLNVTLSQANKTEAKLYNAMNKISTLEMKCEDLTEQLRRVKAKIVTDAGEQEQIDQSNQQNMKVSTVVFHNSSCGFVVESLNILNSF